MHSKTRKRETISIRAQIKAILARRLFPHARDHRLPGSHRFAQSIVIPHATYSPWLDDPAFLEAFQAVQQNSLVDIYRAFELWTLVRQTAPLGGDILEVGVWRGGTGCLMAARAQALHSSSTVFLCDTFAGVVKTGDRDPFYKGGEHADTSAAIVQQLAARMNLHNTEILEGIFPDKTADSITARQFSLCHIDVDAYESARAVVEWAWPRLKPGGVIVYDDFGFATCEGVTQLVNERSHLPGSLTLHNLNGHALVIKTA